MNLKIIAVDFDGTLCENKWPEIGKPNNELITYLKEQKAAGAKLILWTCRVSEILEEAVKWSAEQGLLFDAVNENLPEVLQWMGGDTRKVFANEYIDDRNVPVYSCHAKSWADREIEIACKTERGNRPEDEWDYGVAYYLSALKAYNCLCGDGYSGFSIGMTKYILNRLIDHKCLTPIEDTDDVWNEVTESFGCPEKDDIYQCNRMSSLFKYVSGNDGTIRYSDVDRCYGINVDNPGASYHSGLIDKIMDELFPITMPYFPASTKFEVMCEKFLTDRKNGDFDTVGMLYAIIPDGTRVELNRYFKEGEDDFIEITPDEYEERRKLHQERIEKERNND